MPRILINTNHLEKLQGSEIVTLELAEFLLEQGWYVDIFTYVLGGEIQAEFESLPYQERLLVTNDDNHEFLEEYDYVWIQHNVLSSTVRQRLLDDGMKSHFIFNHMSSFVQMEMPLSPEIENNFAAAILAVSNECQEVLIDRGIQKEKIFLHDNPVPERFMVNNKRAIRLLKNIAIISNHPPKELLDLQEILNKRDISCVLIGAAGVQVRVTPDLIAGYDAIITIGKSVQYALVGGVPVYVYDIYGGEGYLNEDNIDFSAHHNFSGRATKKKRSAEEIYFELIDGFEVACAYVEDNQSGFIQRWSLKNKLSHLFSKITCKNHIIFNDRIANDFSIHNKLLRQWNTPVWSYQKWFSARSFNEHRLTAINTILSYNGVSSKVDVVVIFKGTEDGLVATIDSIQRQHHLAENVWVVSERKINTILHGVKILNVNEACWNNGVTEIAALSEANLMLVMNAGDELLPHTLLKVCERKFLNPEASVFYFDEDCLESPTDPKPMLKPDLNIDLLRSYPYVGRALAFEPGIISTVGGLDGKVGEFAFIDMIWRIIEHSGPACIVHIDEICVRTLNPLLRWLNVNNNNLYQLVINSHFQRFGITATTSSIENGSALRVHYATDHSVKVSIIIPTRNNYLRLRRCIETIIENTTKQSYEIIVADNASQEVLTKDYINQLEKLQLPSLKVFKGEQHVNSSAFCNGAAEIAVGEVLLFISDESEINEDNWLEELVSIILRPEVGIVTAKVINELAQIEHTGIVLGINGAAAPVFQRSFSTANGYMNRLKSSQNISAISYRCLMIKKENFLNEGGFNEQQFAQHFADVDLALSLSQQGFIHVWTPFSLIFQRSNPKGFLPKSASNIIPSDDDIISLQKKWNAKLASDPAYNKQLSRTLPGYEITPYMAAIHDPLPGRPLPIILANNIDRQGCGYYRVIHPFNALEQELHIDGGVDDLLFEMPELARINPDVLLIQPGLRRGLSNYFERARKHCSAKIVIDYDDYSPNIPVRSVVRQKIKQNIIKDIRRDCEQVDWVVVSTAPLAEELSRFTPNIKIAKNGLPVDIWSHLQSKKRTKSKLRVGWAGGGSHTGDLSLLKPIINALNNEIEWVFMGMKPQEIDCEFHQGVPIELYPEKLASLDLDLALVPLEINQFNICKSNLRLLELGACGVPIICTDIEPFRCNLPVTLVANRFNDWMEAIKEHINEKETLARKGDELRKAIHDHWMLRGAHLEQWRNAWIGR